MERVLDSLRRNRLLVGVGAAWVALGYLSFPLFLGLPGALAVGLLVLVGVASAMLYRLFERRVVWEEPLSWPKVALSLVGGLVVVGLAIQAVPFGWDRSNPPVTAEPDWDSPRTRELAVRACFDCHSNEVVHPWYAKIAPVSWAVQLHVQQGRGEVNYSEWDRPQEEAEESAETVIEGEMPPRYYTLLTHSEARLTEEELTDLIRGLEATFGPADTDD